MSSAPYRDILVEIGEVSHITINRPERLNALAMTRTDQELSQALEAIEQSEQARVVILTRIWIPCVLRWLGSGGDRRSEPA